jgi:WS/DGAT/MGAT family acyltransferase
MERISAADAAFLYMENRIVHMHVTGVLVLDPSTVPGGYSFDKFRTHVLGRLHRIPVFRKRLLKSPLGIDHPVWVDDPDFDIDDHLHRIDLGGSATTEDLEAWVGDFASEPLDLSKPLWSMNVIEGFADGSFAAVTKVHHVAVDGATGTDIMAQIVDLDAEGTTDGEPPPYRSDRLPNQAELLFGALGSRVRSPLRGVRALGRSFASAGRVVLEVVGGPEDGPTMARPFDAPRTFFNRSLTRRRSVAFGAAPLDDLKLAKSVFGTTVNDVFLAACTQALRAYLADHGEHLDRPLVVSVPVSVHGQAKADAAANQVSNMFVRLPVHVEDPVEQLQAVRADTRDAKAVHGALSADIIGDVTELTPPAIFNLASRMYSSAGLADRLAPIHNLVISNVPGPPFPLYVAGARLKGVYPFGPLIEGSGLNITVLSNMGNMDIGVIGCPDVAPDIDALVQGIIDGIEVLRAAAEAEEQRAALLEATSDERSAPTADTATPTDTATTADESSDDEVTAS